MSTQSAIENWSGLSQLSQVPLGQARQGVLRAVLRSNCGEPGWQSRKAAEVQELLALEEVAPNRIRVDQIDATEALRVLLRLRAPVPCMPDPRRDLQVVPFVVLGLTYRPEAMRLPQAGSSFVQILAPTQVWHPNVSWTNHPTQCLCLGRFLPRSIRVRELILLTYTALTLQTVTLDPGDPVGIFNAEAAHWWLQNPQRIPLTREPFLAETRSEP